MFKIPLIYNIIVLLIKELYLDLFGFYFIIKLRIKLLFRIIGYRLIKYKTFKPLIIK
jgi:hypothetical protein